MKYRRWPLLFVLPLLLAGCEDMFSHKPARNFNELVNRMIGAINRTTPEEAAANLFNVTSPDERRDAIAYLETQKWGHEPPYMRAYQILTTDPHPMVRAQAMRALGTSYQASSGTYLAKGLDDEDVQVRRDAAYGLISTWNDSAFPPLIAHVASDDDDLVRVYCARALVHASTPESIHALIGALGDKDAAVVRYAHDSLVALARQDFYYSTKDWTAWYQQTYAAPASPIAPPTRPG